MNGTLYFGNNAKPIRWNSIPTYSEFEPMIQEEVLKKVARPETMSYKCEFTVNDIFDAEKLFGYKKRKTAKPERKRLIDRLAKKYGRFRAQEYTLTPTGNGMWKMNIPGNGVATVGFDFGKEEHHYGYERSAL